MQFRERQHTKEKDREKGIQAESESTLGVGRRGGGKRSIRDLDDMQMGSRKWVVCELGAATSISAD